MNTRRTAPGPPAGLLGLRLARRFSRDPLGFTCEMVREYGPIVELKFGPQRAYLVADPEFVHEVLAVRYKQFPKERRTKVAVERMAGGGIIATEGDYWLRQRRLIQPGFAPGRMAKYADVVVRLTEALLDRWPSAGEIDIVAETNELALKILFEAMFQVPLSRGDTQQIAEQAEILSEAVVRELGSPVVLPDWLPLPWKRRKRRAFRYLQVLLQSIIADRRQDEIDRGDMLSSLLTIIDDAGDGRRLTDRQVLDEMLTLLHAGYDSSAAGLVWTCYLLAQHPKIADAVAAEATAVLGDRSAGYDDFAELRYTQQVIQESLRLYPPAWILMLRQAGESTTLADYPIRRGSWIYLLPWVTHRSEQWFSDPLKFDPNRFAPERREAIPTHAYFPFGLGPHRCIGERFALIEMTLAVATMAQQYCFSPIADASPVEIEPHTAIRPRGGLRLQIALR